MSTQGTRKSLLICCSGVAILMHYGSKGNSSLCQVGRAKPRIVGVLVEQLCFRGMCELLYTE